MVAEKNGTIRFYDLLAQQAILSLESEQVPLMSAHWCLKNTFKVGAVAGNDWLIWDITRSRYFLDMFVYYTQKKAVTVAKWSTHLSCYTWDYAVKRKQVFPIEGQSYGFLYNINLLCRFTLGVTQKGQCRRGNLGSVQCLLILENKKNTDPVAWWFPAVVLSLLYFICFNWLLV